jgi:hypothetical protein
MIKGHTRRGRSLSLLWEKQGYPGRIKNMRNWYLERKTEYDAHSLRKPYTTRVTQSQLREQRHRLRRPATSWLISARDSSAARSFASLALSAALTALSSASLAASILRMRSSTWHSISTAAIT